jgi:1-acyl-sn-glycerol-3-phosphate acyltransferase
MRLLALVLAGLWTVLVFSAAVVANLVTLGRLSHRTINLFAPIWGRGVLWLLGVRLTVFGREHLAREHAQVVLLNHASILDMPIIASVCPRNYTALAKAEFKRIPFFAACFRAFGFPFVERGNTEAARRSLAAAGAQVLRHQRSVIIFPEGTRTRDGRLQPFKMGAFHLALATRCPVLPVVVHGAFARSQPGSLKVVPGDVVMQILPPIATVAWTEAELRAQATALHDRFAAALDAGPPA